MLRRTLILLNCIVLFGLQAEYVMAIDKITGPWYWIMVKTSSPGGAAVTDEDWIKDGTGGKLTEDKLAKDGITKKIMSVKFKNKLKWKEGEITPTGGNNVNDVLVKIKHAVGDVDDHCSYAVTNAVSKQAKKGVTARVGSDDSIKVWLNGDDVHTNKVDRGAGDFQDTFDVNLKKGGNVLVVKVCEKGGGWSMFVGIDANLTYDLKFKGFPVEPKSKLATSWSWVKTQRI